MLIPRLHGHIFYSCTIHTKNTAECDLEHSTVVLISAGNQRQRLHIVRGKKQNSKKIHPFTSSQR